MSRTSLSPFERALLATFADGEPRPGNQVAVPRVGLLGWCYRTFGAAPYVELFRLVDRGLLDAQKKYSLTRGGYPQTFFRLTDSGRAELSR